MYKLSEMDYLKLPQDIPIFLFIYSFNKILQNVYNVLFVFLAHLWFHGAWVFTGLQACIFIFI